MSVQFQNVTKTIKQQHVMQNVNLAWQPGFVYGLKGTNGSGKTMLMRLLSGLIRPTEGRILINERELGKDMSFPESIGVLIENPAFLDNYSALDNLRILASIKSIVKDERLSEILNLVGLDPLDKKKYRKFSLGMKQRLGIAAAVMELPDIVVLDEPTNSLDDDGVLMVEELIAKEKARGALIVLTCHDFDILKRLSDEIYLVESGKVRKHEQAES